MGVLRRAVLLCCLLGAAFAYVPAAWAGGPAITDAATGVSTTSATLHGHDNCGAGGNSSFDYGLTTGYGTHVVTHTGSAPANNVDDPLLINGLTAGTTYHFRYNDTHCAGPGSDVTFTTLSSGGGNSLGQADITLTQTLLDTNATVGDTANITYVAKNQTGDPSINTTLSIPLPAGVSLVSATTTQGSCTGSVSCYIGTLNQGDTATIKLAVKVNVSGLIVISSSLGGGTPDPVTSNNTASAAIYVNPTTTARALTINFGPTRAPGFGLDVVVDVGGNLTSTEPGCTASQTIKVYRSSTQNDPSPTLVGTFSTGATGSFSIAPTDGVGKYWTLDAPSYNGGTIICADATTSFTLAPQGVQRTITAQLTRSTNTTVTVAGNLSSPSAIACRNGATISITGSGTSYTSTDVQGNFAATITNPPASLKFSVAESTVGANDCQAATATVSTPLVPLRRIIVSPSAARPSNAKPGDNSFTVTGQVSAVGNQAECMKGAVVTLQQRSSDSDTWGAVAKSQPTDAKGNWSVSTGDDSGQFRLVLDQATVYPFVCAADTATFTVPLRTVVQTITATATRNPDNLSVVHVTGKIDSGGVNACTPSLGLIVENRKAGSNDSWNFVGWVVVIDDAGDFAGDLNAPGGAGLEWHIIGYSHNEGQYACSGVTAPLTVPAQPDQRTLTFTTQRVSSLFAPAEVDGFVAAGTTSCAGGATVTIDGLGGGATQTTAGAAAFLATNRVRSSFTKMGALLLMYPNVPWRVSVPTETVDGVVCQGMSTETRAFSTPMIKNDAGEITLTSTLQAFTNVCRGGVNVSLESLQPDPKNPGNTIWTDMGDTSPGADGSLSFDVLDPGNAYGANAWRLTTDALSFTGGTCAAASLPFTMIQPTPKPPPPPPPAATRSVQVDMTPSGTNEVIRFTVRTSPDSALNSCATGQDLSVFVNDSTWYHVTLGQPETNGEVKNNNFQLYDDVYGTLTIPLHRYDQTIDYFMDEITDVHQPCTSFASQSTVPGYVAPPSTPTSFKSLTVTTGGWAGDTGGNQVELKGALSGDPACIGGTTLSVFLVKEPGAVASDVFAPYDPASAALDSSPYSGTTNPDGTFDFTFPDTGLNYAENGWLLSATPDPGNGATYGGNSASDLVDCTKRVLHYFTVARPAVHPTESAQIASVNVGALPGTYGGTVHITITVAGNPAGSACADGLSVRAAETNEVEMRWSRIYTGTATGPSAPTQYVIWEPSQYSDYDFGTVGADHSATLSLPQGDKDTTVLITASPTSKTSYPVWCGPVPSKTITIAGAHTYQDDPCLTLGGCQYYYGKNWDK